MASVSVGNISRLGQNFSVIAAVLHESVFPGTGLVAYMVRDRTKHEDHPMKSFSEPAYHRRIS